MLATLAEAPLQAKTLVYEPKYDGIRALIDVTPGTKTKPAVARIWSRNGNEKTNQFPAIAHAFEAAAAKLPGRIVLDGEIVALDEQGRPAGFQRLQGRMHLLGARDVERAEHDQPAVFIAFDVLQIGKEDLTKLPLVERRKRLEDLFRLKADATRTKRETRAALSPDHRSFRLQAEGVIRLSEQVIGDATELYARAQKEGWEGLIAKEAASTYQPGRRTPAWR